jgi:bifunctional non-homologous end joining protein LigD
VLPITPGPGWTEATQFTRSIARAMANDHRGRYVATMTKTARRGRIYIDYLRNSRGATAVAPYSTRAGPNATVSTPLDWDELSENVRADHFRVDNLRQRLDFLSKDPWRGISKVRQKIPR